MKCANPIKAWGYVQSVAFYFILPLFLSRLRSSFGVNWNMAGELATIRTVTHHFKTLRIAVFATAIHYRNAFNLVRHQD